MKLRPLIWLFGVTVVTSPVQPAGCASISYGIQTDYGTIIKQVGGGTQITVDARKRGTGRPGK